MKRVFFQGSFDIINAGHCRAFKLAKEQGDYLIIGLNSDNIIRKDKLREPIIPWVQRREILEAIKWIDQVVEMEDIYAISMIKRLNIDVFITIEEWKDRQKESIKWILDKGGSIFIPPYFPNDGKILSSSMIRERIIKGGK